MSFKYCVYDAIDGVVRSRHKTRAAADAAQTRRLNKWLAYYDYVHPARAEVRQWIDGKMSEYSIPQRL